MKLDQAEAFARIQLLRSPNIGPVTYRRLLQRYHTAQKALEALPDLAARGGRPYKAAPIAQIEQEITATRRADARYLFHDSAQYPANLGHAGHAPPILIYRGDIELAARPCLAMVGARNASAAAVKLARDFAAAFTKAGIVVVSGLARGIDGAAHQGSLPATIGVIASGIDMAYPPQHADLQEQIANNGLLLAEQPTGTQPRGSHFPSRNRIIAGLCAGTLVVEAAPRSGSLITARLAGEYGREVMAIPGSPLDPRSHGCNQLIRDGATLVQTPEDALEVITGFDGAWQRVSPGHALREDIAQYYGDDTQIAVSDDHETADIRQLLSTAPVAVDELIRQSGGNAAAVQLALLELEIAGRLVRHAAGRVSLDA